MPKIACKIQQNAFTIYPSSSWPRLTTVPSCWSSTYSAISSRTVTDTAVATTSSRPVSISSGPLAKRLHKTLSFLLCGNGYFETSEYLFLSLSSYIQPSPTLSPGVKRRRNPFSLSSLPHFLILPLLSPATITPRLSLSPSLTFPTSLPISFPFSPSLSVVCHHPAFPPPSLSTPPPLPSPSADTSKPRNLALGVVNCINPDLIASRDPAALFASARKPDVKME